MPNDRALLLERLRALSAGMRQNGAKAADFVHPMRLLLADAKRLGAHPLAIEMIESTLSDIERLAQKEARKLS